MANLADIVEEYDTPTYANMSCAVCSLVQYSTAIE